jgi:hypothetical protein
MESVVFKSTFVSEYPHALSSSCLPSRVCRSILVADFSVEWWHDRMQPWVHYVPINIDYSELYDTAAYVSLPPSNLSRSKSACHRVV